MCRLRLVAAALMCACPAAHALDAGSMSADELAKVLAGVTFIKEMGNVANAKHAMNLFSKVADVHIGEARVLIRYRVACRQQLSSSRVDRR